MITLLIVLVVFNVVSVVTSLRMTWKARRDLERVREHNERAMQTMYEAAVSSGAVIALHPAATPRRKNGSRRSVSA